ncbi:MAG TPA: hypothetical protein VLJ37_08260 [bacterium]|nr:hypothetical protein [bacterium]
MKRPQLNGALDDDGAMIGSPVPAASQLVSYVVGLSASYGALCDLRGEAIDPAFRAPAGEVLGTVGRSFAFQEPIIDYRAGGMTRVRSHREIARYIEEAAPLYAGHWQEILYRSDDLQRKLWPQIEAAAKGFVRAGYDTYGDAVVSGAWAAEALKVGMEIARRKTLEAPEPVAPLPPNMAHLGLMVELLKKSLAQGDLEDARVRIESVRRQSSGAAIHHFEGYFQALARFYSETPLDSRIRDVMALELEASGRNEALGLFVEEVGDVLDRWRRLSPWQRVKQGRMLWIALQAWLRFRRLNARLRPRQET